MGVGKAERLGGLAPSQIREVTAGGLGRVGRALLPPEAGRAVGPFAWLIMAAGCHLSDAQRACSGLPLGILEGRALLTQGFPQFWTQGFPEFLHPPGPGVP